MKEKRQISTTRLINRRDFWLKKLATLGPFTRGSLVTAQRGGHTAYQLTVSVQGKTHTVYVPKDMTGEVKEWIKNHGRLQRIIKEVSKLNMAIIHRHIPEGLGADRRRKTSRPRR